MIHKDTEDFLKGIQDRWASNREAIINPMVKFPIRPGVDSEDTVASKLADLVHNAVDVMIKEACKKHDIPFDKVMQHSEVPPVAIIVETAIHEAFGISRMYRIVIMKQTIVDEGWRKIVTMSDPNEFGLVEVITPSPFDCNPEITIESHVHIEECHNHHDH